MREVWESVDGFPGYIISSYGNVMNEIRNRPIRPTLNQRGIAMVGLTRDGVQQKRALDLLVARQFIPDPTHPAYDSIIHLDGDRRNCRADNLLWRPRWFAVQFHRQMNLPPVINVPVEVIQTEETFENSQECAMKYGLLERDILSASINGNVVWPTELQIQRIRG